jgi:hypothetical protein
MFMPDDAHKDAARENAGAFRTWLMTLAISFGLLATMYSLAYVNNGHHAALDSSIGAQAATPKR